MDGEVMNKLKKVLRHKAKLEKQGTKRSGDSKSMLDTITSKFPYATINESEDGDRGKVASNVRCMADDIHKYTGGSKAGSSVNVSG